MSFSRQLGVCQSCQRELDLCSCVHRQPEPIMAPACPHCGVKPCDVATAFAQQGAGRLAVFYCSVVSCNAILSVQVIGVDAPMVSRPSPSSLLV